MGNIKNNIEDPEYRVERFDKSKLIDLEQLYKIVYGSRPEEKYFAKKYNTAFTKTEYIGYLAYSHKNIPIAYYGVIPCFIQCDDKIILAAQSGDTMTHPQHRNRGMFVKLAALTYELCKQKGILLVFGFPNQNSYHGLVHNLGWRITEYMSRFTITLKSFPVESLLKHFQWSKWVYEKYTRWALRKYFLAEKGLPSSSICDGFSGVYRSDQYLQYKSYSDTLVIKIVNAKAWIKVKEGINIGDLDLANQDFNLLIESLKKIGRKLGISQMSFQVSPGTSLHSLFAKKFDPIPSFPVGFKDLGSNISLDKVKFTFADIDIF